MTSIVRPTYSDYEAWASMLEEYATDGTKPHGGGLWWVDDEMSHRSFDEWLMIAARLADTTRPVPTDVAWAPNGVVHCDEFFISDDEQIVGFIQFRHELNAALLEEGGHIGYSIRPSRRREGHASRALGLVLDYARQCGLDRVLITCDDDNIASAATIESQGGVLEDVRKGKRRYWIDLYES